jgi:hypothetical protein
MVAYAPSIYGGVETQLASNGSTTFAAVNELALPATLTGYTGSVTSVVAAVENATGEMVAVSQDTGTVDWDTPLPSAAVLAGISGEQKAAVFCRFRHFLPKRSNSPFRAPPRKACHSSGVNLRTEPSGSRLLRTPISPSGRLATSTQLPLEKLSELLTQ